MDYAVAPNADDFHIARLPALPRCLFSRSQRVAILRPRVSKRPRGQLKAFREGFPRVRRLGSSLGSVCASVVDHQTRKEMQWTLGLALAALAVYGLKRALSGATHVEIAAWWRRDGAGKGGQPR